MPPRLSGYEHIYMGALGFYVLVLIAECKTHFLGNEHFSDFWCYKLGCATIQGSYNQGLLYRSRGNCLVVPCNQFTILECLLDS